MRAPLLIAFALAAPLLVASPAPAETIDAASFGTARVAAPPGAILGYVALFSGDDGWTAADDETLAAIARAGALAVGVDSKMYLDNLRTGRGAIRKAECVDVFQDVEDLSRQVQARRPSAFYNLPIVAGVGEGGALADAALVQAPTGTLSGAVAVDPTAKVALTRPLCRLDSFALDDGPRALSPVPPPPRDLTFAFDDGADALTLAGSDSRAHLVELTQKRLLAATASGADSLPLAPLPAAGASRVAAILLSGDGGWRDLDKTIGEKLQAAGVPVLGWDSLRYFWSAKTPDQTAADLAAAMAEYGGKWRVERFALIGYSFGADALPAVYNRLPIRFREQTAMLALLGVEPKADWEIHMAGWLGAPPSAAATPIAPELAKIAPDLIQCFYGVEETGSACPALIGSGAEVVETPGDHHFGHDYAALAARILDGLRRRGAM